MAPSTSRWPRTKGPVAHIDRALEPRPRQWHGDYFFALTYLPGPTNAADPRRQLVRGFKAGHQTSLHRARNVLLAGLMQSEPLMSRDKGGWLLVPMPGHVAGPASFPLQHVGDHLASQLQWLRFQPNLLVRTRTIRQSSTTDLRPTFNEHLGTLGWTGPPIDAPAIIIDDVYTLGRTSAACRQILMDAGASCVVVVCLAATSL